MVSPAESPTADAVIPFPLTDDREEIARYVRFLCAVTDWNPTQLARAAGVAPSTVNRYIDLENPIKHTLSTKTLAALQRVAFERLKSVHPQDFDALVAHVNYVLTTPYLNRVREGVPARVPTTASLFSPEPPNFRRPLPVTDPLDQIPIRSAGRGGEEQEVFPEDGPIGWVRRPASLVGFANGYAIYMVGDSMEPRYQQGWLLFVNPNKPPVKGRDVVIYKVGNGVMVKEFVARRGGKVFLRQLNPAQDIEIPDDQVRDIHLIIGVDQET